MVDRQGFVCRILLPDKEPKFNGPFAMVGLFH